MKAVDFLENASVFLLANGLGSSIIQDSDKITFRGDTQFLFTGELYLQCPNSFSIEGSIDKKTLFDFLSKIREQEIEIEQGENGLKIKSGRSVANFVISETKESPVDFSQ